MLCMFKRWKKCFNRFADDERGAIAIAYGPFIIILLVFAGIAIDYARAYIVKKEISRALDAAALAAGSMPVADEDDMQQMAELYFNANLSKQTKDVYSPKITLKLDGNDVTVTSEASVPTTLMKIAHFDKVDVDARTIVSRALKKLEVALVLDNTGSMRWSGKMTSLKDAADKLIEELFLLDESGQYLKMAIVPFTGAVNVGTQYKDAWWIDGDGDSTAAQEDYGSKYKYWKKKQKGMTAYEALAKWKVDWSGCVRARVGKENDDEGNLVDLDLSDVEPNVGIKDTLFAPYVKPLYKWEQGSQPPKWEIKERLREDTCAAVSVLPLTDDQDALHDKIDEMFPSGYTSIPVGLAWGWRILSSNEPFTEGVPYDDDETIKVIVLLTDGKNEMGGHHNNVVDGLYNAYGMPGYDHLGDDDPMSAELNNKLETLCSIVKGKNILIYSITFQVNDNNTKQLMQNCASPPHQEYYYNVPSGGALKDAFINIAKGLSKLRIAK